MSHPGKRKRQEKDVKARLAMVDRIFKNKKGSYVSRNFHVEKERPREKKNILEKVSSMRKGQKETTRAKNMF